MSKTNKFARASLLISSVAIITALTAITINSSYSNIVGASECIHEGNHYRANNPTHTTSGNKEFWACCKCHNQFLSEPAIGTWSEVKELTQALDPTHVAYVAAQTECHFVPSTEIIGHYVCEWCGEEGVQVMTSDDVTYTQATSDDHKCISEYNIGIDSASTIGTLASQCVHPTNSYGSIDEVGDGNTGNYAMFLTQPKDNTDYSVQVVINLPKANYAAFSDVCYTYYTNTKFRIGFSSSEAGESPNCAYGNIMIYTNNSGESLTVEITEAQNHSHIKKTIVDESVINGSKNLQIYFVPGAYGNFWLSKPSINFTKLSDLGTKVAKVAVYGSKTANVESTEFGFGSETVYKSICNHNCWEGPSLSGYDEYYFAINSTSLSDPRTWLLGGSDNNVVNSTNWYLIKLVPAEAKAYYKAVGDASFTLLGTIKTGTFANETITVIDWSNTSNPITVYSTAVYGATDTPTPPPAPGEKTIALNALNGAAQKVCSETALGYLSTEDDPSTENNEIAEYLYKHGSVTDSFSSVNKVNLSWSASEDATEPYKVSLYTDKECNNLCAQYTTSSSSIVIKNLIPQTYYYKVTDSSVSPITSAVDSFTFSSHLRTINTGTDAGIQNMRDIGGFTGEGGKTTKYGMIFRSANWDNATDETDEILKSLNIKTEIDVRLNKDGKDYGESKHAVEGINFIQNGFTDGYPYMFVDKTTLNNMNNFVNNILTNKNNYPLDYHCANGADRTGLASLLIESILGWSDEDIYRDYELTTYFMYNQRRADIIYNDGVYSFNPTGKRADLWAPDGKGSGFMYFFVNDESALQPYYAAAGNISDAVINFLKDKCGLTDANVNVIRSLLLE